MRVCRTVDPFFRVFVFFSAPSPNVTGNKVAHLRIFFLNDKIFYKNAFQTIDISFRFAYNISVKKVYFC